jgi:hypothetical protein
MEIWNALAAHTVFGRWSEPTEVAAAIAFLACDAASYITGTALLVDGGWTAIDGPPTGLTKTHASSEEMRPTRRRYRLKEIETAPFWTVLAILLCCVLLAVMWRLV